MNPNGCGLGLSICKKIVEMFGGELKVTSVFGEGSEFSFIINIHTNELKKDNKQKVDMCDDMTSVASNLQFKWKPMKHRTDNITLNYINDLNI